MSLFSCKTFIKYLSRLWIFFLLVCPALSFAQFSALGVSPNRVVIGPQDKGEAITLTNDSKTVTTYRMTLIEMGIDKNGKFRELIKDELPPNYRSAVKHLRFSPRQIRLQPGQSQVIRIIARRSRALPSGEYRSHLVLRALPIVADASLKDIVDGKKEIQLFDASSAMSIGISMPIILRHGEVDAKIILKGIEVFADSNDSIKSIKVNLGRKGNRSVYGGIKLYVGNDRLIGEINGYALYDQPELNEYWLNIPVRSEITVSDIKNGIRTLFTDGESGSASANWLDSVATPTVVRKEK